MVIGKNMKFLREEKGLLQKDMAKILDVAESTYSHYESGDAIITLERLILFCNYFNVSIDYMFGNNTNRFYDSFNDKLNKDLFSMRFKKFRKESKLTQKKLAEELNVGLSVISGYETTRYVIATQLLYEICRKYKVSADYLLGIIDYDALKV